MTAARPPLFRKEALDHHLQVDEGFRFASVAPPWTWTLLCLTLLGLGSALLAACLGRVEVTGRGRGILQPRGGIRLLVAQVAGTIEAVAVQSGQRVAKDLPLLRIDAPLVQAQVLEARRQAQAVRGSFRSTAREQDRAFAQQAASLSARALRLKAQVASQAASVALFERHLKASLILEGQGILSRTQADGARETLAQAQRQQNTLEQALEQLDQEQACLEHQRQDHLWQRHQTIQNACAREASLALLRGQTVIRAPREGVVEALLVEPGEVVQPGQVLGRLLSLEAPLEVVCFLPEKDRAFVHPGDEALLELDQLPYPEFGTLQARVVRIGEGLASPAELGEALGGTAAPDLPAFRVVLGLTGTRAAEAARVQLRPGMLANVRFTLRRQPLITLVLDPLRRWLR